MLWPAELVCLKHFSLQLTTRVSLCKCDHFYCRPKTCHYIKFKQMASYYPMLAPQCCGNECFFNWLGGHVLEERLPSAPNVLPSENELSTARGPHLHYPLWEPQTCHTAQFLRVSRSRRTEIASHFISSSEFLQAGAIFLCRSVVRSNKHIPVAETTTPFPVSLFPR